MKFIDLKNGLKKELDPLYVITGSDFYLKDEAVKIFNKRFKSDYSDFNIIKYDILDSSNIDKVFSEVNVLPFFDSQRLLIIKDFDNNIFEKLKSKLNEFVKNKNSTTSILIFDKDYKIKKALKNKIVEIDCSSLDTTTLKKIISLKVTKAQRSISVDAANKLVNYCENDLSRINNELEKIIYYVNKGDQIKTEIIDIFVEKNLDFKIFELTNYMAKKDFKNLLIMLEKLFKEKVSEMAMLTLIYNHFSRLFHVAMNPKQTNKQLSKYLGIKEYAVTKLRSQTAGFNNRELRNVLENVVIAENNIKTGKESPKNAIYNLIFSK